MILEGARLGAGVVDVRVDDGIITAIAPHLTGSAADERISADGRWLIPGLWDQHVHLAQWAMSRRRVDVSSATSAAHAAAIVAASPRPQNGLPLVGHGFRDGMWPDAPTAAVLDTVVGDVPVVLISADLHCCWLNTAALRRYGHEASTGLVREDECFAVVRALDDLPDGVLDAWVAEAGEAAAARGVVGVVDLEMNWGVGHWTRRFAGGFNHMRVRTGVYPHYLDRAIGDSLRTGQVLAPGLEVGPFKIITDGSLNTRTAYCHDPYPGLGDYRGELTVPTDELVDWLRRATGAGLIPAVHAIGDDANARALDAFAAVGVGGRIEHAQLLSDADVPRFAQLGVAASVQPEHAMDDRDVADRFWDGRTGRAFVLRSLLDAGARLLLGSDAPVAPLDPWVAMSAATARARDGREPWHPEQGITVAEAIVASSETAIAVGQPADLVLVDRDPHTATADELRHMPVGMTLFAGRVTHSTLH